jgi:glycosyltransferase involved in cell wall biosynthesis
VKIALITTDNREHFREYTRTEPYFGAAPEALLQGFSELKDIEVHVLSCTQNSMTSPERLADNIFFDSLHVPKFGWLRTGYQGCIRAIRKRLQEIQPKIVHGQGTERECAICSVFSGFPNVITIHGNMSELAKRFRSPIGSYGWLTSRLENFTLPRTLGVFCNSTYTQDLVQTRNRKTWLVPNAIRTAFLSTTLPPQHSNPKILVIGTITERKRPLEILALAEKLHRKGYRFEINFVGQPNSTAYGEKFLREINSVEKKGYAQFVGAKSLNELIQILDSSSALIHFPSEESFGLVVAEALARNLKVFASKIGGINEIVQSHEEVALLDPNNWMGLESEVGEWIATGCSRPKTSYLKIAEKYAPLRIAQTHFEVYHQIIADRKMRYS